MERWTDRWAEIHYQETAQIIAVNALAKQQRREQWWQQFNERMAQRPETD